MAYTPPYSPIMRNGLHNTLLAYNEECGCEYLNAGPDKRDKQHGVGGCAEDIAIDELPPRLLQLLVLMQEHNTSS